MTALAFVDTETTGLDPRHHDVWEIAVIRREDGYTTEHLWQVRPDLANADPEALEIGKFHERFAVPDGWDAIDLAPNGDILKLTLPEMLFDLQDAVANSVMIGSNPAFDDRFLKKLLQDNGRRIGWHYRTIDIATLAAGFMWAHDPQLMAKDSKPISSRWLSRQVGVEPPGNGVAHTALGDARWARDVYDAVTRGAK